MPAYYLKCDKCQNSQRKILARFVGMKCECGGEYQRTDSNGLNTVVKETLDNGVMVRKVERIHNIEELIKERSKDPKGDDFI